jgi:hypothetical protein
LRTLRQEVTGFDFYYPLETDTAAGHSDSLHYYLYSDRLSWETMRLDATGIPRAWSQVTSTNYWPGFIAWYALVQLGHYLRGKGSQHLNAFLKQIDWLEEHAVLRGDGAVVWTMDFDNPENGVILRAVGFGSCARLGDQCRCAGLARNQETSFMGASAAIGKHL